MGTNTDLYRSARDQLVALISDYDKAVDAFAWPQLTGAFNWATDWFDVIARDPRPRTGSRCGSSSRTAPSDE